MKSQAVASDGAGMPGVSGELKVSGPPICGRSAKLPGVVPSALLDGFWPRGGSSQRRWLVRLRSLDMIRRSFLVLGAPGEATRFGGRSLRSCKRVQVRRVYSQAESVGHPVAPLYRSSYHLGRTATMGAPSRHAGMG